MRSVFRHLSLILVAVILLFSVGCTDQSASILANAILQSLSSASSSAGSSGTSSGYSNDLHLVSPDETEAPSETPAGGIAPDSVSVVYGQPYSSKDEVAAYLHEYGELPPNFITKSEAQALGWDNALGNLWKVTDHKSIGGDYFGNYENLLPKNKGRTYHECDVNYKGRSRGTERIVYSNDGLIYYTSDHYNTFTLLYGED